MLGVLIQRTLIFSWHLYFLYGEMWLLSDVSSVDLCHNTECYSRRRSEWLFHLGCDRNNGISYMPQNVHVPFVMTFSFSVLVVVFTSFGNQQCEQSTANFRRIHFSYTIDNYVVYGGTSANILDNQHCLHTDRPFAGKEGGFR